MAVRLVSSANRRSILWLPEEYQSEAFAAYKGTLVVGQAARKVSFVEFDQDIVSLKIYIEISPPYATPWHLRVAYGGGTE